MSSKGSDQDLQVQVQVQGMASKHGKHDVDGGAKGKE